MDDRKQKVFSFVRESGDSIFYHIKTNKIFTGNDEGNIYGLSNLQARSIVTVIRVKPAQDIYHSDCLKNVDASIEGPAKGEELE